MWKVLEDVFGNDEAKYGVAEKLESLIGVLYGVRRGRPVTQRAPKRILVPNWNIRAVYFGDCRPSAMRLMPSTISDGDRA